MTEGEPPDDLPSRDNKDSRPSNRTGFARGNKFSTGRPKGSPNRIKTATQEAVINGGESPLEILLKIARDPQIGLSLRASATASAAPYVHAKVGPVAPPRLNPNPFTFAPPQNPNEALALMTALATRMTAGHIDIDVAREVMLILRGYIEVLAAVEFTTTVTMLEES